MADKKNEVALKYSDQYVTLSNELARAREKVNLLESKIELLAISRLKGDVHVMERTDGYGNPYAVKCITLHAKEIQDLMGRKDWDSYSDIYSACNALKHKIVIVESKEDNQFIMRSLYDDIIYDRGKLTIGFNPTMEKYFYNLSENFTKLSLSICFSFKHTGALQLYKIFRSEMYKLPPLNKKLPQEEQPSLELYFSLTDLRMHLGLVDIQQAELKKELEKNRKNPNFEKIASAEKAPKYVRFTDLERRIIKPGIKDLNEMSDIYVSNIEKRTSGKGGKISGVTFTVQWNTSYCNEKSAERIPAATEKKVLSESEKLAFYDDILEIVPIKIKIADAQALAEDAGFDLDKIKKAVDELNRASGNIDNVVGWLRSAIRGSWSKVSKKNNAFNDFKQNTYDYDELEQRLVAN